MNIARGILSILILLTLFSCENEVEINGDFQETTTVFGILEPRADTQFVKITKSFLDDNQSAVQLAGQPDRLYFDSLDVFIKQVDGNGNVSETIRLRDTIVPKDEGFFTQDRNVVYYTTERINVLRNYNLEVVRPDGIVTTSSLLTTNGVGIATPSSNNISINFINTFSRLPTFYEFEFSTGRDVGQFEALVRFIYTEIDVNNDSTEKEILIPLATFPNSSLTEGRTFRFRLEGDRFFQSIEQAITPSLTSPRRIFDDRSISIELYAADANYSLYIDVNGPIDGLSQTRTEFTNITNGIGVFASRFKTVRRIGLNPLTASYIYNNYGDQFNNAAQFRGFERP